MSVVRRPANSGSLRGMIGSAVNQLADIATNGNRRRRNEPHSNPPNRQTRRRRTRTFANNDPGAGGDNVQRGSKRSGPKVSSKVKRSKKRQKVSKKLKAQVEQILTNKTPSGYYQERFYYRYTPGNDSQAVYNLGQGFGTETGQANGVYHFFDPTRVLDAASCLYNDKAPTAVKGLTDPRSFAYKNIKINVLRQWVQFEMKNLTARRIQMKLYTWELKNDVRETATVGGIGDFADIWSASFTDDAIAVGNDGRLNIAGAGRTTIGASPQFSPQMKRQFKMEEKIINIEAGKTVYHMVQGPRRDYDFSKFWERSLFVNDIKGIKGCCLCLIPDTIAASLGGIGQTNRSTNMVAADPFGICVETIYNYVIQMPEQAGFALPTAVVNTPIQLKQRRDAPYCIKKWNNIPPGAGTGVEIDDENPQNQATVGI